MKKQLLLICIFLGSISVGFAQTVSIINKKFVVNGNVGCPIYFNGTNTPWDNWNDFGGNYDATFWSTHFATLKANGINASRVWISCNGDVQPNINTDGTVTGVSAQFWANLDNFFQSAQANGIYIMATMMSFDHTKNTYNKYQSWRNMLNDQTKVQTYCDNYLVPFVNRYKSNPYLMSIDISNEIEWVAEDATNMKCSYAVLQRFVAMCASAIHNNPRTDGTTVLVTLGSAATKWNATKMRNGSNGTGWQNNSDGNKWSDAALKAQYNQANAILDYYSPHYYSWIDQYYSNPFERTPTEFGMDEKPVVIGETPAGNPGTPNLTPLASYNVLKNNGYQGHFPWTSNAVDAIGGISKFGADAKTFAANNNTFVYPTCSVTCATIAPTVTTPITYCKDAVPVSLTAEGSALKWYADNTTTTALTGAPIPSTAAVGTKNYYVSQTLNNCEGPRALIAITVNPLPAAAITTTTPTTFCQGGSVTLTSSGGTSYQWNNAIGPIAGATAATYAANASGSYTVKVTNANTCSATSAATVVTVNPLPATAITTTTPTTFCQGRSVALTSSGGTSYQWNNAIGPIAGATAATYAANASGSYTVKVTNANICSATSAATIVTVNSLPAAAITTTTPTTFCQGGSVTLTSSGGTSYQWNNTAGPVAGATAAMYAANASGSYTVKVTNANTCSATSAAIPVTVKSTITWYQDSDGDGKGDAAITQTACTQPTGYVSVSGDACPADANKIAAGACGCGNAETNTDSDPTPDCMDTDDDNDGILDAADCAPLNAGIGAPTIWYLDSDGDGKGDAAAAQTACIKPIGYVSVSGDACAADANKLTPGICGCGIEEGTCQTTDVVNLKSIETIKIMPNPSSDQFNLVLTEPAIVNISTVDGKLVETFPNATYIKFGSEYAKGVYIIQIMNGSATQIIRIVKQ